MTRVLYIGDVQSTASITSLVTGWGYDVSATHSGEYACELVAHYQPNIIIIDANSAGSIAAVDLCRELRSRFAHIGLVFWYASDRAEKALDAFSAGADDCISKVAPEAEFRARLAALIRRFSVQTNTRVYGDIALEPVGRTVIIGGVPIELTPTQFRMLDYILRNSGRVIGPGEFKTSIFKSEHSIDSAKIRVHICELRRRLGTLGCMIESVRGKGYGVGLSGA
jgi:DNA-binding response OmpR family regulator